MMMNRLMLVIKNLIILILAIVFLTQSSLKPPGRQDQVRAFTRMIEFNFIDWTLDALLVKNAQEAVSAPNYLDVEKQRETVFEYIRLVRWIRLVERDINTIYANPDIAEPEQAAAALNGQLHSLREMENRLRPIAESIVQHQISTVVAELGLGLGGQPIPPVLYHVTDLPDALIVSPRSEIRQLANISLVPELTVEEISQLEESVEQDQDVSALVVPIGGVGTYPTMVMTTTDINWLMEVVSHEWIHNFLTLRPLGLQYMSSGEMRTINETTANIAGKEIGRAVIERYYPELAPPPPSPTPAVPPDQPTPTPTPEDPTVFNFNRAMRETRLQVDTLLAEGKIEEAEAYMEERRRIFWENGYQIRRLNQAYFAFYGAYNDQPGGGAGGADPVGPAVQELRKRSPSLAAFLNRISWVNSFADLQELLQ